MPSTTTARHVKTAGVLLLLLGVWGALLPFAGPAFGYDMGGGPAWTWTESHATLHLLPGVAAVLGGLLLVRGRGRVGQTFGAVLAALAGIWFVIGPSLHPLWAGRSMGMMDMGSALSGALSDLGYHYGTGALITVVSGYALGVLVASRSAVAQPAKTATPPLQQTSRESSLVDAGR